MNDDVGGFQLGKWGIPKRGSLDAKNFMENPDLKWMRMDDN